MAGAGWYDLLSILQEGTDSYRTQMAQPPIACPHDGEPLRAGPDGQLYCPSDGWRPTDDPDWH